MQHTCPHPGKQGDVPPEIISTEVIDDAMIVDELTEEMSIGRRMQKAEDQSVGEGKATFQRRKRICTTLSNEQTLRWKDD